MVTGDLAGRPPTQLVMISRSLWADTVGALRTGDPDKVRSVLDRLLAEAPAGWDTEHDENPASWRGDRFRVSPGKPGTW